MFRPKSNSGAINVFVGIIILIQYSTDIICKCDGEEAKSLNNKLNKYLHSTVVIKFYRIFVTELVFTFFAFRYENHFEFPKDGIKAKSLFKNSGNSWAEEGESSKTAWNRKSWGVGGGHANHLKSLPWWGYGYFLEPHILN